MQLSSSVPSPSGIALQVLEEAGELADEEQVDLLELLDLFLVAAVVRELVVAVVDADHAVGAVGAFVGGHERDDPRRVGLEREGHQVVHQADVLLHVVGHALRAVANSGGSTGAAAAGRRGLIRCSISRTLVKYWSIFCWSVLPRRFFRSAACSETRSSTLWRTRLRRLGLLRGRACCRTAARRPAAG